MDVVALLNGREMPPDDDGSDCSLPGLHVGDDGALIDEFLARQEATLGGPAPAAAAAARREEPPPRRLLEAEPEPMRQEPLRASRESAASSERPAPAWEDEAFADDFRRRPQHQRAALRFEDRRDAANRRERDAKKQSELRLRCAGLSRSVRELGDANARLKEELELARDDLARSRARCATLAQAVTHARQEPPPAVPFRAAQAAADESGAAARTARKKMEELRSDVADARRREKRAVELGAALRKRVAEERQRAEDAEASAAALEAALGAVTKDRDAAATRLQRAREAHGRKDDRAESLAEKARAAAQREQELVDQLAEQRKRHGKQRRDLEKRRHDAERRADAETRNAQALRDECLALRARVHSAAAAKRVDALFDAPRRRPLDDDNKRPEPAPPPPPPPPPKRDEPKTFWSDDDDDDDDDEAPPPAPAPRPAPRPRVERRDDATARYERLQATFSRLQKDL